MSDTNLFNSVVRFIREYNYSDNLFSKSFLEYLSKHHQNCFIEKKIILSEEKKKSPNTNIKKIYISNVINVYVDSEAKSLITTFNIQECRNQDLIEAYNRLDDLFFFVSPRILNKLIFELHREFVLRFNKTPFELSYPSKESYKIVWKGKLLYLDVVDDFIFIDDN